MAKKNRLRFFDTEEAAFHYLYSELIATLEDDLREQIANKEPATERTQLRQKIHDMELIAAKLQAQFDVLKEWVSDVEALFDGEQHLEEFWPDMFITYQKAQALVKARTL